MKHERFHDDRLSPQENKAVEMQRNGASRAEIADEMDIDRKHLSTLFYTARKKGVDVPRIKAGQIGAGRRPRISIEYLEALHEKLVASGMRGNGLNRAMEERTGLSANCIKVRLWRWRKGIRPMRNLGEHAA